MADFNPAKQTYSRPPVFQVASYHSQNSASQTEAHTHNALIRKVILKQQLRAAVLYVCFRCKSSKSNSDFRENKKKTGRCLFLRSIQSLRKCEFKINLNSVKRQEMSVSRNDCVNNQGDLINPRETIKNSSEHNY